MRCSSKLWAECQLRLSCVRRIPSSSTAWTSLPVPFTAVKRFSLSSRQNSIMQQHTTLGLVREDPLREWERRTCLTPTHVQQLIQKHNVKVLVQPSDKRCFRDAEYTAAGATITQDLSPATVILGVKEVPIDEILQGDRLYIGFWHIWKGQDYNVPRLRKQLSSGATFADWELLCGEDGARTAAFGYFAGWCGQMDSIASTLSMKLLSNGYNTAFVYLPRPIQCRTFEDCKLALAQVGEHVAQDGTPASLGPIVFAVVGTGRVASGAIDVLKAMNVEWVKPEDLKSLVASPDTSLNKLYAVQFAAKDYLRATDGSGFDRADYRANPDKYRSIFAEKYAPYVTSLLNGAFYRDGLPRIMTTEEYVNVKKRLVAAQQEKSRLVSICDVSADWSGGLEFVKKPSTINDPTFYLDAQGNEDPSARTSTSSTAMMTIEILPAELPLPSSEHFSACAFPYLESLFARSRTSQQDELLAALHRSTIVKQGQLVEPHTWLSSLLQDQPVAAVSRSDAAGSQKRVLVLGSGLVAGPACEVFLARKDVAVTIASQHLESATALAGESAKAIEVDISDTAAIENLVKSNDVVLSLLPAPLHVQVAELCIKHGVHLVTASYQSEQMKALQHQAMKQGVTIMMEIGLDPGIDHLLAAQMIQDARREGREITSFVSWCGGLPEIKAGTGLPLKYKLSWSPRGVLSAATNSAQFIFDGKRKHIPGDLLLESPLPVSSIGGIELEGLANRNSFDYLEVYELDKSLPTMFRGTLRHAGTAKILAGFKALGLFSVQPFSTQPRSWPEVLQKSMELKARRHLGAIELELEQLLPGGSRASEVYKALQWFGLVDKMSALPETPLPGKATCPMDYLEALLSHKLSYTEGERDLVILQHEIGSRSLSDPKDEQTWISKLVLYGDPTGTGHSAMAKTVGIPAALATLLILDGQVKERGVVRPIAKEVYVPLLRGLKEHGIVIEESRKKGLTDYSGY